MKTKYDFKEIFKLKDMLDKEKIQYDFNDRTFKDEEREFTSYQICYPNNKERYISVIQSFGSYGREQDLLEIMGLLTDEELKHDSVAGYLTAEDVFNRIQKNLKDTKNETVT